MSLLWLVIFIFNIVAVCRSQRSSLISSSSGNDSILEDGNILVSGGGVFAMGFFTPNSTTTTNRYIGIWFNSIQDKTPVWVANRDNPLTGNNSGILKIIDDGNIALLDAKDSAVIWSSNVTIPRSNTNINTTATLKDTGEFVLSLTGGDGDTPIWASFDHPTDTILPGMKFRFNFTTGVGQRLVAWKNSHDPSTGDVYFEFDPNSPLQNILWHGPNKLYRYGIWHGSNKFRGANGGSVLVESFVKNDEDIYYTITATGERAQMKFSVVPTGSIDWATLWNNTENLWDISIQFPSPPCSVYNRCGPFGICDDNGITPPCKCLEGFERKDVKEWNKGNFSSGCVRKTQLSCEGKDRFMKLNPMIFPDKFEFLSNLSAVQCEEKCNGSCECTAYAYINSTTVEVKDLRCLLWDGELIDISLNQERGGDLYVRLAASDVSSNSRRKTLVIITISIFIGILVLVFVGYFYSRRLKMKGWLKKQRTNALNTVGRLKTAAALESEKNITELPMFDYSLVLSATNNFSSNLKLGEGGFGPVFKGKLAGGQEIAVKRLSKRSGQGSEEFRNEIQVIGKLQHKNLVTLLGWCSYDDERMLIYEYLSNKSLDKIIFDRNLSASLNWQQRYCIIEGIAQGLLYLHKYSKVRIIHRDLKTSNILLDATMNSKISDFGLARIFGEEQTECQTERVVGTYGYMSPEYAFHGHFSEKSDVFSFGVLVLEIITGQRSHSNIYSGDSGNDPFNLLEYAWRAWEEGRARDLVDESLTENSFQIDEVIRCAQVALLCVQEFAIDRPTTKLVVSLLGKESSITSLPIPKQPSFALGRRRRPNEATSSVNEITITDLNTR